MLKKIINKLNLIKSKIQYIVLKFKFKNINIGKNVTFGNQFSIFEYSNFSCKVGNETFFRGGMNLIFFQDTRQKLLFFSMFQIL